MDEEGKGSFNGTSLLANTHSMCIFRSFLIYCMTLLKIKCLLKVIPKQKLHVLGVKSHTNTFVHNILRCWLRALLTSSLYAFVSIHFYHTISSSNLINLRRSFIYCSCVACYTVKLSVL